jgi:hypothetical protein
MTQELPKRRNVKSYTHKNRLRAAGADMALMSLQSTRLARQSTTANPGIDITRAVSGKATGQTKYDDEP